MSFISFPSFISFIYTFMPSSIHSFHSFISFISFIHPFISFVCSFVLSFLSSFIDSFHSSIALQCNYIHIYIYCNALHVMLCHVMSFHFDFIHSCIYVNRAGGANKPPLPVGFLFATLIFLFWNFRPRLLRALLEYSHYLFLLYQ